MDTRAIQHITEDQVLASAGLDAYVFSMLLPAGYQIHGNQHSSYRVVIMFPVHYMHTKGTLDLPDPGAARNSTSNETTFFNRLPAKRLLANLPYRAKQRNESDGRCTAKMLPSETMLWLYLDVRLSLLRDCLVSHCLGDQRRSFEYGKHTLAANRQLQIGPSGCPAFPRSYVQKK